MGASVILSKSARKDLRYLPSTVKPRVLEALKLLADNPYMGSKLEGYTVEVLGRKVGLRKVRVGDYRVVYGYSKSSNLVYVVAIDHRKNVYKRL
jgi:mRNA interferase RelE/StbE